MFLYVRLMGSEPFHKPKLMRTTPTQDSERTSWPFFVRWIPSVDKCARLKRVFSNNLKLEDCREKRKRLSFRSSISLFRELNLSARIAKGETESKRKLVLGYRLVKSRRWFKSVTTWLFWTTQEMAYRNQPTHWLTNHYSSCAGHHKNVILNVFSVL